MVISNSTNVNAREALIEYALRRMSISCHSVLIFAKHFFRILPGERVEADVRRLMLKAKGRRKNAGMKQNG
jgi:hypothetical protein